jgi:hypothetical protein
MKSTIILKPLEYNISTIGETWRQGDLVAGTFTIKNQGPEKIDVPFLKLALALGNIKKIASKDPKGLENLNQITLAEKITLEPLSEKEFSWNFKISDNSQLTLKDKSLFITFTDKENTLPTGQLQLNIVPKLIIVQYLEILEHFLRFKIGPIKFSNGAIEIKLTPPKSKQLTHVDSVTVRLKESDKVLSIHYSISLHSFEMTAGNMIAQKKTKELEQEIPHKDFYIYGDSVNQDHLIKIIGDLITTATPKFSL